MTNYSSRDETTFDGGRTVVKTWEDGYRTYSGSLDASYVSVTTVLSRVFGEPFPEAARGYIEHARQRGTEMHRAVALLSGAVQGMTANFTMMDPEVAPRVKLICGWMKERRWVPIYVERAFFSTRHRVAGTPDQVGWLGDDKKFTVLEFKPWKASRARLQTAGYSLLVRASLALDHVPNRVVLHVKDDAIHETWHEQHARDRDIFLSALNCHAFGVEEGIWE